MNRSGDNRRWQPRLFFLGFFVASPFVVLEISGRLGSDRLSLRRLDRHGADQAPRQHPCRLAGADANAALGSVGAFRTRSRNIFTWISPLGRRINPHIPGLQPATAAPAAARDPAESLFPYVDRAWAVESVQFCLGRFFGRAGFA